jgi:hypothetical protein
LEAVIYAKQYPPSLVLLDLRMPRLDGWAVLHVLQDFPATRQVPVVLLTGNPALAPGVPLLAILLTLFVGLGVTTAIGLAAIGKFNVISVAFIPLFVGIGIDFAIQYSVRYRAERHAHEDLEPGLVQAGTIMGPPLTLAAAATALCFYSFMPTSFSGVAELGFIVVEIDGMGNPTRSKKFHDAYYGNMGDNTLPDQITAMKQLAEKYPWIDLERVGIYGHSGGGYATADAMFRYPDSSAARTPGSCA